MVFEQRQNLGEITSSRCSIINLHVPMHSTSWVEMVKGLPFLKVRGPFVETFCIEKDPYIDAI